MKLKTKRYFTCIKGCDHEFFVEHLLDGTCSSRTAGPWYCDVCGLGHNIEILGNGEISVTASSKGQMRTQYVLLELPPQKESIFFEVEGMRFEADIDEDHDRYYYEEHTCPTNWFRKVLEVSIGKDGDPHGLWKHVRTYDIKAEHHENLSVMKELPSKEK